MVAVSPIPSGAQLAQRQVTKRFKVVRAVGKWFRLVAGRLPGEFTIAKLDSFNRFRQETTPSRLAAILLLSPLPCLFTSLVIESIPLADPATGFQGSLHFQIRNFLTAVIMIAMPVFMKINCIPKLTTRSWSFVLGFSTTTAAVAIVNNAVISVVTHVFPVPFTQFAPTIPMAMVGVLINRFFPQQLEIKQRFDRIDQWLGMDMLPVFVYPVFTAVFMALKTNQQMWISLLLPVIKRLVRHVIWLMLRDDLDLVGPTACSVGHLYHVLFTAMCLQNSKSVVTVAAVVVVTTLQMLLNCRGILKDTDKLQRSRGELSIFSGGDVVSAVLDLAQQKQVAKLLHRKRLSRMFSTYPGYQGIEFVTKHRKLLLQGSSRLVVGDSDRVPRRGSKRRSLPTANSLSKQTTPLIEHGFVQILPSTDQRTEPRPSRRGSSYDVKAREKNVDTTRARAVPSIQLKGDRARQVRRTSATSPRCCIKPRSSSCGRTSQFLYCYSMVSSPTVLLFSQISTNFLLFAAIYLVLVFWLPNRKYFATMATMTTFAAVDTMLFYLLLLGSVEVVFLVIYLVLISHRFGVSGLHQLGFVLWSRRVLLQSKFVALSIMILGLPLEHYGNGIIFKLRTG